MQFLVTEAGIWQFLDIGTELPSASNTHQVARQAAPESRVVYVDNDPIVPAHARALLTGSPEGATDCIDADLRAVGTILPDFGQPVAVMLLGILQGIPTGKPGRDHRAADGCRAAGQSPGHLADRGRRRR